VLIVFIAILAGAFAGAKIQTHLPKHHLTDETKSLVNVSTAVIATVSALVLGLLISNANIIHAVRRRSHRAIGTNPPAGPHLATIWG
jgi:hypothetical protein